jgi:hypothetical protein
MDCYNCTPSESSLEFARRKKPESNNGCGCGRMANTCESPSYALEGSALYNWEQIHGKLATTVTTVLNENGHWVQVIEKKPCPIKSKGHKHGCCALVYRANR